MRNIFILTVNDLAISYKNKTVYLVTFIPLFVFFTLAMVDHPDGRLGNAKIGVIRGQNYPEVIISSLQATNPIFSVTWLSDEADGRKQLEERAVDGVLLPRDKSRRSGALLVLTKESIKTIAIVEGLSQLQRETEARTIDNWVSEVIALQTTAGFENQTLPIWILMIILLVGFLIIPPQVAEEKEKKLLLGLLQTPMREADWLLAKVLMGMILAIASVSLLHTLSRAGLGHAPSYLQFLVAGSFCFNSMGVLLGALCRTQASARALGVVIYLPHLLPSALSDFSDKLNAIAAFIPSYQFFIPMKAILSEGANSGNFGLQLAALLATGILCCGTAHILIKKRWLL